MPAGIRSFAAFWMGGISGTGIPIPEPSCPCPEWGVDPSVFNTFTQMLDTSCTVSADGSVFNSFEQKAETQGTYGQRASLINQWVKRNCE